MSPPENKIGQEPPSLPIIHVNQPPNLKTANDREEWSMFKILYENYAIINRLSEQPPELQRAIFLSIAGPVGVKIYSSIKFESEEHKNDVKTILQKFDEKIIGHYNETYERYVFNQRSQTQGESIDEYVCALTTMAKRCSFCDCLEDNLIRDRIVIGIHDNETRKSLLQKASLTLEECINICKTMEAVTKQLKIISKVEPKEHNINKIKLRYRCHNENNIYSRRPNKMMKCLFCSKEHVMAKYSCPAWGRTCYRCGMRNHFKGATICPMSKRKSPSLQKESAETSSDSCTDEKENTARECSYQLSTDRNTDEVHAVMETTDHRQILFQIDSGSPVNIIPLKYVNDDAIMVTKKILTLYNGLELNTVGECKLMLTNPRNGRYYNCRCLVVDGCVTHPLGKQTSEEMGLITINYDKFIKSDVKSPEIIPKKSSHKRPPLKEDH